MSDSAFQPPSEPPPSADPPPWRRVLGLALDVLIVLIVLESWELPFIQLAGGLVDGSSPLIGGVPSAPRGFGLSGRGGQIIGLGATGLAMALQAPFLFRRSTLGLSLFGLQVRASGRKAPPYLSIPWTLGAWTISIAGFVAIIAAFASLGQLETSANTLAIALAVVAVTGVNLYAAVRNGRSLLDRALGVEIPEEDHLTGWKPRPDFVAPQPHHTDKDLHAWRTHTSPDPLAPIWGPDPGPMLEAPEDPDHVELVGDDDPFAAVGSNVDRAEEQQLADRLRRALDEEPDRT